MTLTLVNRLIDKPKCAGLLSHNVRVSKKRLQNITPIALANIIVIRVKIKLSSARQTLDDLRSFAQKEQEAN